MGNEVTDILLGQEYKSEKKQSGNTSDLPKMHTEFIYGARKEENANELIGRVRPEFIVLIGLEEYGKTTFLGSLYHQLRSTGSIDKQQLIDSDTLAGFENKIFLRAMNKEGKSDVIRTTGKDAFILSLDLQDVQSGAKRQIIISDRAGETYYQYVSNDALVEKDKTLTRADRVLLFVDSEKLMTTQYVSMMDDYRTLLKRLKDVGKYPSDAVLYAVFNKIDKIDAKSATFTKRKESMINIFKILKENVDKVFEVDSKHLLPDENTSDIWKLQRILVNPL